MNIYIILRILGAISVICGISLFLPGFVGVFYNESECITYFIIGLAAIIIGLPFVLRKAKRENIGAKEGFVTVAAAWILMSLVGALPFYITKEIPSYIDAVFETASGFSTTGASILTNVELLSHTALFWRSFTHWIGGMGMLVFLLAFLPMAGGSAMQLMKAESPGPSVGKIVPKLRDTAMVLYIIYTAMTILESLLLMFGGMPWFDSITTALGTAGTGGFAVRAESIGFYDSYYLQGVITVFMIAFGVNFSVYYLLLAKKWKDGLKNEELWTYLGVIAVSILVITINIRNSNYDGQTFKSFHDAAFSVASVISTTGFGTADFNLWPTLSKMILVCLMFFGASAGSTGGGIKISRIILLLKSAVNEIATFVRPRSVRKIKLDGKVVRNEVLRQTKAFFIIVMVIFAGSVIIVSLDGFDTETTVTSVIATMNNIGPGLGMVGPTGNYAAFSNLSKIVMIFDMLAGRLEYFPMLVLMNPITWKAPALAIRRRIKNRIN